MRQITSLVGAVVLCSLALSLHPITAGASGPKPDQPIVGEGLIVRVIAGGDEPVFRADGYAFRITAQSSIDQGVRIGGAGSVFFPNVPVSITSVAIDPTGQPIFAGNAEIGRAHV